MIFVFAKRIPCKPLRKSHHLGARICSLRISSTNKITIITSNITIYSLYIHVCIKNQPCHVAIPFRLTGIRGFGFRFQVNRLHICRTSSIPPCCAGRRNRRFLEKRFCRFFRRFRSALEIPIRKMFNQKTHGSNKVGVSKNRGTPKWMV